MIKHNPVEEFENNQILAENLPQIEDVEYEMLDLNYRTISLYVAIVILLISLVIYIVGAYFLPIFFEMPFILIAVAGWLLFAALILGYVYKSYIYKGYALRQKDIIFKTGMFFKSTMIIPFNRVQHCEINQGPIDRYYKLATLSLFTAGGSSSDLNIPGIRHEKAERIKKFITGQVSIDEEE